MTITFSFSYYLFDVTWYQVVSNKDNLQLYGFKHFYPNNFQTDL